MKIVLWSPTFKLPYPHLLFEHGAMHNITSGLDNWLAAIVPDARTDTAHDPSKVFRAATVFPLGGRNLGISICTGRLLLPHALHVSIFDSVWRKRTPAHHYGAWVPVALEQHCSTLQFHSNGTFRENALLHRCPLGWDAFHASCFICIEFIYHWVCFRLLFGCRPLVAFPYLTSSR